MLALLLQWIGAISTKLVTASYPLPFTHVVRRHPTQIANTIHRSHNVTLKHIRCHNKRSLVRRRCPSRINTEHRSLRPVRTRKRLDQRVLATSITKARREQIRHMPVILDHPIRPNSLQQLRPSSSSHLRLPDILPECRIILRNPLRCLQPNIQRKHRPITAI